MDTGLQGRCGLIAQESIVIICPRLFQREELLARFACTRIARVLIFICCLGNETIALRIGEKL